MDIVKARIISGELYPYLKDIGIIGRREKETEKLYIYGCITKDEERFYKGVLEACKANENILGLKTIEETEEFWLNGCEGMFLTISNEDYEIERRCIR